MMQKRKAYFITFEGTEGSGKSTQIRIAAAYLRRKGCKVLLLREPGGTRVSEAIREVLLTKRHGAMTRETELLLYLAARAQIVREKILPALKAGKVVICDRYEDSTLAYQGFGRKIPLAVIERMSRFVRGALRPGLVFLLDIPPLAGMKRGGRRDRMERQSLRFHEQVRRGFLALARKDRRRYVILDAGQNKKWVADKVKERLDRVFRRS